MSPEKQPHLQRQEWDGVLFLVSEEEALRGRERPREEREGATKRKSSP